MPTPRAYVAKTGTRTWRVRLRNAGRYTSETFATRAEAERFCRTVDAIGAEAAIAHHSADQADASMPTLDQLATSHIDALSGITDGTRSTYRRLYARTWQPVIGGIRVDLLTRADISRAVNTLTKRYADKSVANAHGLLAAILAGAVTDGLIRRSPAAQTRLPRSSGHTRVEARFLTQAEFATALGHLPEQHRPVLLMLGGTGMRWGELEALVVGDVDRTAATVRITKAVKYGVGAERAVGPPKTARSRRVVTLPPQLLDELRPLLAGRPRTAPLFTSSDGQPIRHHAVYRAWKRACAAAGIDPQPRLHDCRHSHTAWLIAAGIPIPVIQARLGHESVKTTIDTYGHLVPDLQIAATHAAGAVFSGLRATTAPTGLPVSGPAPAADGSAEREL